MEKTFPILIILVIVTNGLWIWSKIILKRNGMPVNWFWNHNKDIANLWRLAKKTENINSKRKYYLIALSLPIGIIIAFTFFFIQVPKAMIGDPCEYEERFRNRKWNGIVIKKYKDSSNHNYETIEINSGSESELIRELTLFSETNFAKINIGDSISKEKGDLFATLFMENEEIILNADYGCE